MQWSFKWILAYRFEAFYQTCEDDDSRAEFRPFVFCYQLIIRFEHSKWVYRCANQQPSLVSAVTLVDDVPFRSTSCTWIGICYNRLRPVLQMCQFFRGFFAEDCWFWSLFNDFMPSILQVVHSSWAMPISRFQLGWKTSRRNRSPHTDDIYRATHEYSH